MGEVRDPLSPANSSTLSETEGDAGGGSHPVDLALSAPPSTEFVQEFSRAQRRVFLYILTLIPHPADAEEILQDTNLVIWSKAQQFRPGSSFAAWACQIAYYEVLKFRERHRRDKLQFSDEFLQSVAAETEQQPDQLELRRQALTECLAKLRPADRELIQQRYAVGADGISVAAKLSRPVNSIYQSLGRIRRALLECVTRRLSVEGRGA